MTSARYSRSHSHDVARRRVEPHGENENLKARGGGAQQRLSNAVAAQRRLEIEIFVALNRTVQELGAYVPRAGVRRGERQAISLLQRLRDNVRIEVHAVARCEKLAGNDALADTVRAGCHHDAAATLWRAVQSSRFSSASVAENKSSTARRASGICMLA